MIGVNLSDAMAEGRLSEEDYCELVTRCRSGGCSERCEAWLACQNGLAEAATAHCANADALNRLRRGVICYNVAFAEPYASVVGVNGHAWLDFVNPEIGTSPA